MRTKIKINTKYYRLVSWLVEGDCTGCVFRQSYECPHEASSPFEGKCGEGQEFDKHVLIPATKVGLANYIALKLNHESENQLDN